jgi:4-alpha-glucanotransferase
VSIGAPPDEFNFAGQDWGLPPFVPHRLRAAGYRPLIETLRATLRHAGGLRLDHVLGLFRLWWVPAGHPPDAGAYVRNHADELLAVLAVESHRARAIVIGEDLGTVESGVRRTLAARNVLSTRLALFDRRPSAFPVRSHGGVTTHDLPTIAGLWSGGDLWDQARAGVVPDVLGNRLLRKRLARWAGVDPDAELRDVIVAAHAALASAPAVLVTATLEDATAAEERPNLPGTTELQRPNWSLALPASLEAMGRDPLVARLARAMRR